MYVVITAEDLMERGLWEEACEVTGFSVYAVKEDEKTEITLTEDQAIGIGLIRPPLGAITGYGS